MAYRMCRAARPELMDLSQEPRHILWDMYGIADPSKPSFARNCLLARRLIERGVRFVQNLPRSLESSTATSPTIWQGIATTPTAGLRCSRQGFETVPAVCSMTHS